MPTNPFANMSPEAKSALIQGAFQVGGGLLSGAGQSRRDAANRQTEAGMNKVDALIAMLREQGERSDAKATNSRLGYQGAAAAIGNPLDIQKSRQDMAMRRALLFDGPNGRPQYVKPASGVMQQYANVDALPDFKSAKSFFTDDAMMNSEKPFWGAVGGMTGGKVGPDLAGSGYQNAGSAQGAINQANQGFATDLANQNSESDAEMARTRAAVMQALSESAGGSSNPAGQQKKGGFWRGLGKVAALAAPFVAAPFTGGTSLALIGAGSAAAGSLLNGGSPGQAIGNAALSGGLSYAGGRLNQPGRTNVGQNNPALAPPVGQWNSPRSPMMYPQNSPKLGLGSNRPGFGKVY